MHLSFRRKFIDQIKESFTIIVDIFIFNLNTGGFYKILLASGLLKQYRKLVLCLQKVQLFLMLPRADDMQKTGKDHFSLFLLLSFTLCLLIYSLVAERALV